MCTFDELSTDSPLHRLLAQTLGVLARAAALPPALRRELQPGAPAAAGGLPDAALPPPTAATFRELRRQRPDGQAAFLLHVCELVWQTALPTPTASGRRPLRRFPARRGADGAHLRAVHAQFLPPRAAPLPRVCRNHCLAGRSPRSPPTSPCCPPCSPIPRLEAPDRKIILDTKYYAAALRPRYDRQRLIAPHLYQLYAYLQNQRPAPGQALEGMLLYPAATARPWTCATPWAATRCASSPSTCTSPGPASPPICWRWWNNGPSEALKKQPGLSANGKSGLPVSNAKVSLARGPATNYFFSSVGGRGGGASSRSHSAFSGVAIALRGSSHCGAVGGGSGGLHAGSRGFNGSGFGRSSFRSHEVRPAVRARPRAATLNRLFILGVILKMGLTIKAPFIRLPAKGNPARKKFFSAGYLRPSSVLTPKVNEQGQSNFLFFDSYRRRADCRHSRRR